MGFVDDACVLLYVMYGWYMYIVCYIWVICVCSVLYVDGSCVLCVMYVWYAYVFCVMCGWYLYVVYDVSC